MPASKQKASLFLPCLADLYYPEIGRAAIKVLRRAGLAVDYPREQTCCGQWAYNQGQYDAVRAMAKHFIAVFEKSPVVVSPSGSCVLTVRRYPELLADEPVWQYRAKKVAARTYEITDFLVNRLGVTRLGARFDRRVVLHDSCHPLRGLGLKDEPRELLRAVDGLELVEMAEPEICCGFGGAFMAQNPQLSTAMAQEKIDQAYATGADCLVLTEPGCLLNVDTALKSRDLKFRALHLVQVLAAGNGAGEGIRG